MIKVIIFDADGMTIKQERPSIFLPRDYGINAESLLLFFNGPFQECLIGKADLKEILPPFLNVWGWDKGVEAFLNLWFSREIYINEDVVKYINDFKSRGILCSLATNQEKYRLQYFLNQLGFSSIFDRVYSSTKIGHKKPSREFFSEIFKDFKNIKKEEILFWDDRPKSVEEAKKFGFNAELYISLEDFEEKIKKYLI